jgi:hypothetical protein
MREHEPVRPFHRQHYCMAEKFLRYSSTVAILSTNNSDDIACYTNRRSNYDRHLHNHPILNRVW